MSATDLTSLPQDAEWASDWKKIVEIYNTIDMLEKQFAGLDVSYLREIQQQQIILQLKKYAWTLQNMIIQKYSE